MPAARHLARRAGLLVAALVVAAAAAGCSSGGDTAEIAITDQWARASSAMAAAAAAYMTISNNGTAADALIGASSPAAETVEVHETVAVMPTPAPSDGMGGGMESPAATDGMGGGMMGMQPIARLEIPAGGTVKLEPGGYHIMLIGLTQELKAGDKIEITLTFEKAGEVKVEAEVRES